MKYIVIEIQNSGTVSTITTQHDTRQEAEGKFHQVLSAAAISSVPVHSAILLTDEGFPLRNESYRHPMEEPEEE